MNLNTEQYFSEVPALRSPRSMFDRSFTHKTTMNVNNLYPVFIDEALPGDSFKVNFQVFGRLINPLTVSVMDELYFEMLWFKCPMRLLWDNSFYFFGERENPNDSTDYLIPVVNSGENGFAVDSLADHFGIPVLVPNLDVNALPFRMYNRVYNEWFRDQNLIESVPLELGDSDNLSNYKILKSAKMHDLFTSCSVSPQLGDPVIFNITGTAPVNVNVYGNGMSLGWQNGESGKFAGTIVNSGGMVTRTDVYGATLPAQNSSSANAFDVNDALGITADPSKSGLIGSGTADLSTVTGFNVNDLRFAIKLQQYRERLMTGGHRYREIVSQFFGVDQLDNRAYITEFLGCSREMIDINTVIQTSSTDSVSPLGTLSSYGVVSSFESGFTTSFVEHSYIMGIARIRHNPVYQQGLNKLWSRQTQLDFYNPMFNGLGEQPVLNKEIMAQGKNKLNSSGEPIDDDTFGFNEYGYEYRFYPSIISGQIRSGIPESLDAFHFAQYFGTYDESSGTYTPALPVLNQSFIEENIPIDRALSVKTTENIPQFVMDFRFNYQCARVMPVRNVPAGLSQGI